MRNEKKFDNQRELSSFQLAPKKQDFDKTMEKVQELKEKGNIRFKGKDFSDALTLYSRALTALGDVEASTQEEKDKVIELKVVLICNRAACSLSLKDYDAVIKVFYLFIYLLPLFSPPFLLFHLFFSFLFFSFLFFSFSPFSSHFLPHSPATKPSNMTPNTKKPTTGVQKPTLAREDMTWP